MQSLKLFNHPNNDYQILTTFDLLENKGVVNFSNSIRAISTENGESGGGTYFVAKFLL